MGALVPIFYFELLTTNILLYPFFIIDNIFPDLNLGESGRSFSFFFLCLMEYEHACLWISTPDKPSKDYIFVIRCLFFQIEILKVNLV